MPLPIDKLWVDLRRWNYGLATASGPRDDDVSRFAVRDPSRPLIALVGLVKAGKSSFLNALVGSEVGVVANREQSSHPIFLGWGDVASLALRHQDGTERTVSREEFARTLAFDENGCRNEDVISGIVRLPEPLLDKVEFVDLPGLGGRHSDVLDELILDEAARCPLTFLLQTRLRNTAVAAAVALAQRGTAVVCLKTKSDMNYRKGNPSEIPVERAAEVTHLLERLVIAPVISVTIESVSYEHVGIVSVAKVREKIDQIRLYYQIATTCGWIAARVVGSKNEHLGNGAVDLHRQAAAALCLEFGDARQARVMSAGGRTEKFMDRSTTGGWKR